MAIFYDNQTPEQQAAYAAWEVAFAAHQAAGQKLRALPEGTDEWRAALRERERAEDKDWYLYGEWQATNPKPKPRGRPSQDISETRLELRVPTTMKAWIKEQGGAAYVRRLVEADRAAREGQT